MVFVIQWFGHDLLNDYVKIGSSFLDFIFTFGYHVSNLTKEASLVCGFCLFFVVHGLFEGDFTCRKFKLFFFLCSMAFHLYF
jgi:hypothetical protein